MSGGQTGVHLKTALGIIRHLQVEWRGRSLTEVKVEGMDGSCEWCLMAPVEKSRVTRLPGSSAQMLGR